MASKSILFVLPSDSRMLRRERISSCVQLNQRVMVQAKTIAAIITPMGTKVDFVSLELYSGIYCLLVTVDGVSHSLVYSFGSLILAKQLGLSNTLNIFPGCGP